VTADGVRHFLDLTDIPAKDLRGMIEAGRMMKAHWVRDRATAGRPLAGKTLAMVFDKPSTRARVLSRYVDAIMIRILDHAALLELARHATVPVINGLTRLSHPCQVMADVMTFEEHRGPIHGKTIAWTGDDNNVLASWMHAAARFEFRLQVATPPELAPKKRLLDWMLASGAAIVIGHDAEQAVIGADCVVTDTWVSMGDKESERRHNLLRPYQVNARLMAKAKPDAIFMHCLPAHRGEEVTDEVIDGPQSVVFDEAENRLHAQKGILAWCLHAT
jgi:ornithine carbamoyltransferase